jgi:type 2 lantibiotic biosynthesis protein LanM
MNRSQFQASTWYHAIPLTERIATLKAASKLQKATSVEINPELAQKRMQRWRSQSPFNEYSRFSQRLKLDNLTEEEFLYILGEPIEAIQDRFSNLPDWLSNLAEAFSHPSSADSTPKNSSKEKEGEDLVLFLQAIDPLISRGCARLKETVDKLSQTNSNLPFDPKTIVRIFYANLPEKLLAICSRTMVLELQIAGLQGLLPGNTPKERFDSFIEYLRQQDRIIALLQEYPIMANQLVIAIEQWVTVSQEFLHRLCEDWQEIQTIFSPQQELGKLVEIKTGEGDSHRDGRSVATVKFSSGLQLIYKPRSLAVDEHFQQLLTWLNRRCDRLQFRTIAVLNRNSYGWVEFVESHSCNSREEIERFYQRQGGFLALLYILEATDFHNENSIAAGENPVLVDLESLFHPNLTKIDTARADKLAGTTLYSSSVIRIGLLPWRVWSDGDRDGIDVSGLGGKEGQLTPYEVSYWDEVGTDQMRLKRKRMKMLEERNRPKLNGEEVDVLDYTEAIVGGFRSIYNLILQYRNELRSDDGIFAKFAGDEVRVLLRPTRLYALLLKDALHPKMLRNALERERLFDRLWYDIEHRAYMKSVIRAERQDLWNGDIPVFAARPDSRDLLTSTGERIVNFFAESGMTSVKNRLQNMGEEDLKQQIFFIKASFASLEMSSEQAQMPSYTLSEPKTRVDRDRLLKAAAAIGDRLEKLALCGHDDAIWIGLTPVGERYWALSPSGLDFYNGLPGIILFLAHLGAISQQLNYTSLARAALKTITRIVEQDKKTLYFKSIGAFSGWGGIIYTLSQLAVLWDEPELLTEAEEIVEFLPTLIEKDKNLDIMAGAAGCIIALTTLYRCTPSKSTLAAAIACGDRLLAEARQMHQGIGWVIPDSAPEKEVKPLTGLSHGAAGIASALLELAAMTGEERFHTAALTAIAYERSLFVPQMGNWPDLRSFINEIVSNNDRQHVCQTAWCHGAPGIGLARLRSLPYLNDREICSEIEIALQTTLKDGFGGNHSLCHGDLGNLELLLVASLVLDDSQWQNQVERFTSIILESIERNGWLCGVPLGLETPGLMTGIAGIGYQLLRLADPNLVPSVLLLEAPKFEDKLRNAAKYAIAMKN